MEERMKELVAIGAAVGANCKPCLRYHVRIAVENGASEKDIMETIQIAKMVRMVITPDLARDRGSNSPESSRYPDGKNSSADST